MNSNKSEEILLAVLAGLLVLGVAIYGFYLFLPFLVFYVLPVVLISLSVGFILRLAGEPKREIADLSRYQAVVATYALMLFVVGFTFFKGIERAVVVNEQGKLTGQVLLEWPKLDSYQNAFRKNIYADAPFEGLRAKAKVTTIYDRFEVGWIFLVALFLGGPVFYFWLSRNDAEEVKDIIEGLVSERVRPRLEQLNLKERNLNETIELKGAPLKARISDLEKMQEELFAENQVLKAKLEFAVDVPRPSESVKKDGGVLDQDIF